MTKKINLYFNLEDVSQIAIGAFALAVPISFSEEAWKIGETLPIFNLMILVFLSFGFLSFYAYENVFQANIQKRFLVFVFRVFIAYLITVFVVAMILLAIDKFPILDNSFIAIKRMIVIAMPASMGAIIVDSFDKE
ncbi:DUF2391 family protein [Sulfurimonas sp.]|uniref:DUF2391 family protein n=1 Tax=Sulfurimonas sp. TaxID=2022749 RepID=UPI00356B10B7